MDRIGAVLLIRRDGAVLLQHRDDKPGLRAAGQWVPPGGHCDQSETAIDGARRELLEETGYRCDDLAPLASFVNDFDEGWPPQQLHVFWGLYDGSSEIRCYEGQEVAFVPRVAAGSYGVPEYVVHIWDQLLARPDFAQMPGNGKQ